MLEKYGCPREDGGAIGINTNGWRALEQLGVATELREKTVPLTEYGLLTFTRTFLCFAVYLPPMAYVESVFFFFENRKMINPTCRNVVVRETFCRFELSDIIVLACLRQELERSCHNWWPLCTIGFRIRDECLHKNKASSITVRYCLIYNTTIRLHLMENRIWNHFTEFIFLILVVS